MFFSYIFVNCFFSVSWLLKFWNQDCIKPLEEAKRKENTNHRRQKGRKLSKSLEMTSHCQQWLSLMLFVNYKTTSLNDVIWSSPVVQATDIFSKKVCCLSGSRDSECCTWNLEVPCNITILLLLLLSVALGNLHVVTCPRSISEVDFSESVDWTRNKFPLSVVSPWRKSIHPMTNVQHSSDYNTA